VTVSWNGISTPMAMDWIALYTPGAADEAYIVWVYVSCSQTPGAPAAAGSCSFVVPSWEPSGTYEMRLLANNLFLRLMVSNRFAVTSSS
jgi:hypothetical protein